jgi:hypothetical protein
MKRISHKDRVDSIISQFWREGYLTLSRKHGNFLPPPEPVGTYEIEALGKYKKNYVIGITLNEEDLDNDKVMAKIKYLSSKNTIFSSKNVKLFIAVPSKLLTRAYNLIAELPPENRDCIKLIPVTKSTR